MSDSGSRATDRTTPRLTVARAGQAEREALVAQVRCAVVDATALDEAADAVAAERRSARAAVHHRAQADEQRASDALELAAGREHSVRDRQDALRAGAEWARQAESEVAAARAAVAGAEAQVEEKQAEQRRALASLDRVLEQRAAANAAMAEADHQLAELGVAELDESGLRRQLEASGHAVREAQGRRSEAAAALEARRAELAEVVARQEAVAEALAERAPSAASGHAPDDVVAALERWETAAAGAGPDETAAALVEAWSDLQADLASVADAGPVPDGAAIEAAEARVRETSQHLALVEAATGSGPLSDAARAEIEAAHGAVLALEERSGRRIGGGSARRELEHARAREAELLAAHGFASYIDVVLTGGRPRHDSPELMAAARAYRNAVSERDALVAASTARPELAYLDGERARLHRHIVELLGVDPGDDVAGLLRGHPAVPAEVVQALKAALDAVGVRPVGQSLPAAAGAWLAEHHGSAEEQARRADEQARLEAELDQLIGQRSAIEAAVAEAERSAAEAEAELERATRSVSSFEAELSMRADEDARRLQRFAAAEQLRIQVEALAATLATAEADARQALDRAATEASRAESALDRAAARLGDLTRRARELVAEVPVDRRPEDEPLAALDQLADELDALAAGLDRDVAEAVRQREQAEAELERARSATAAAELALRGPQPEDHEQALRAVLTAGQQVLVLDEPFGHRTVEGGVARAVLLEAAEQRSVVLLTEDPELLGWAIELPSEKGRVVPVDALNLSADPADDDRVERAILELNQRGTSDLDAPTMPAPWAGRR
ncbi:MAG: hypothetical protein ACLGI8_01440 [Acidimicrobiia bacterium]|jgi:hypothetical protein